MYNILISGFRDPLVLKLSSHEFLPDLFGAPPSIGRQGGWRSARPTAGQRGGDWKRALPTAEDLGRDLTGGRPTEEARRDGSRGDLPTAARIPVMNCKLLHEQREYLTNSECFNPHHYLVKACGLYLKPFAHRTA